MRTDSTNIGLNDVESLNLNDIHLMLS